MTLQEAKDKVAQREGYKSWTDMQEKHKFNSYKHECELILHKIIEASSLHAQSCAQEAYQKGFDDGCREATSEACKEISKNYTPDLKKER